MPDFENESKVKLRWYIENFPSPHPFFKPAVAALEKKEADEDSRRNNQSVIHLYNSNVANLNLGSQVGSVAANVTDTSRADFIERLRQAFNVAELEWSLLGKAGDWIPTQMICRRVDDFQAALTRLYGQCPSTVDPQPLRSAIEILCETTNYRVGDHIGSQTEVNRVCELMEAALAGVKALLPDNFAGER